MKDSQKSRKTERMWEILLSEIENGNVIPVIGSELFCINVNNKCIHLNEYIIREIADALEIDYSESLTFTELAGDDYKGKWKNIGSELYYETNKILKEMSNRQIQISDALQKLLSIEKFKVVLTTAFDDWTFKTMEEKWRGTTVRELSYKKRSTGQDIDNLSSPLLYHIFGKADVVPHSYVLTEDDLLDFLHCWLSENYRPKRLANVLREKYLLVVGCNYPNWLFRFFIHSMKNSLNSSSEDKMGMVADSKLDDELVAFLSRINAQNHCNTVEFIDELVERWQKRSHGNTKKEIFVSYASKDYEIVTKIVDKLKEWNVKVWFDKHELEPADEYAEEIKKQIRESKAFVPILSKNTLVTGRHFFKREWEWGRKETEWRGTEKYIYPIVIEEIDLESDILPEKFKDTQMIDFSSINFDNDLKKLVRDLRLK
jgi:hypothetical protein